MTFVYGDSYASLLRNHGKSQVIVFLPRLQSSSLGFNYAKKMQYSTGGGELPFIALSLQHPTKTSSSCISSDALQSEVGPRRGFCQMVTNTRLRVLSPTWKEAPVPFVTSHSVFQQMLSLARMYSMWSSLTGQRLDEIVRKKKTAQLFFFFFFKLAPLPTNKSITVLLFSPLDCISFRFTLRRSRWIQASCVQVALL